MLTADSGGGSAHRCGDEVVSGELVGRHIGGMVHTDLILFLGHE